jgi:hypothetical protein
MALGKQLRPRLRSSIWRSSAALLRYPVPAAKAFGFETAMNCSKAKRPVGRLWSAPVEGKKGDSEKFQEDED